MPLIERGRELIGERRSLPDAPIEPERPDFFEETLPAAFRLENTIGSFLASETPTRLPKQETLEPFDPFSDIEGTIFEQFPRSLIGVGSAEEKESVRARLEREMRDRETLHAAGAPGMAALLASGFVDPIFLIPVGGQVGAAIKGGSLLRAGLVTARAGLLASSAAEIALQTSQDTRTYGESALNVAGATLLSGILGSSATAVSRSLLRSSIRQVERDLAIRPAVAGGVGDDVVLTAADLASDTASTVKSVTTAEEKIASALGLDKAIARLTPMMRLVTSPSAEVRRVAQRLLAVPIRYEKNALGLPTSPGTKEVVGAVEDRIAEHWGRFGQLSERLEDLFVRMRTGKEGGGGIPLARVRIHDLFRGRDLTDIRQMSFREFREEVGKAMRRGDRHPVPEVQIGAQFARELVFEPLKDLAQLSKLLPEDLPVETALSYLSRVYNHEKITRTLDGVGESVFIRRTMNWLRSRHAELGEDELMSVAEGIRDRILHHPDGRIPYERMSFGTGSPLKSRTFLIEDDAIEDFLESDVLLIARHYVHTMAPDVEIAREFGDLELSSVFKAVAEDYRAKFRKVSDPGQRSKLEKARKSDESDISALVDTLRGTYAAPRDPDGLWLRFNRGIRRLNLVSLGGGFMVSSLPDIGSIVMAHGLRRTFMDGLVPLVRGLRSFRASAREVKLSGTAWDMVLNRRAAAMADIGDEFGRHSRFERGLEAVSSSFTTINLLTPWNAAIKQFTGVVTQAWVLRAVDRLSRGVASKEEITRLAASGIGREDALRIAEQFSRFGKTEDGVRIANTIAWDVSSAELRRTRDVFRQAIRREVDTIIVTPGAGDRPLWMTTETGKTIGQFKSFAMAATQRVTLLRLQQRDMAALNGLLLSVGLGMSVYALKTLQANRPLASTDTDDGQLQWLREGIDRSGVIGILSDGINMAEKVGIPVVPGGYKASRYASRNVASALGGPTVGLAQTAAQATRAVAQRDFVESDVRAIRKLVPYQNLFYLSKLFDEAESQLNRELGVRRTQRRR